LPAFTVRDLYSARGQQKESVDDRPHLPAQGVGKAGTEVHHSFRKRFVNISQIHEYELLPLEMVGQVLGVFKALGTHDAHPVRRSEKITEVRVETRTG
jgi:hypothetical protein